MNARLSWLKERRNGIGGSDAAAVLGLSPWKSALELYCDKIGLTELEDSEPDWLYWGKALEPVIAARYEKETGRATIDDGEFLIQRSAVYPWMCCTTDRTIDDPAKPESPGVLSIKNIIGFKKSEWEEEPPVEYQIQLQHELVVTRRTWGSFAVLFNGNTFGWFDVERNEKFCSFLIEKEREFWDRIVIGNPPPPGNPADSSREALGRLYPNDSGSTIALDGEFIILAERIRGLKDEIAANKEELERVENKLKAAIGDNTYGVLPNGMRFSLKTIKKPAFMVEACEYRTLRRLKG